MGQFTFITCDTKKKIKPEVRKAYYVLIPKEFGGGHYKEEFYDGYGHFAGHDIYDLVADWNKQSITKNHLNKPIRTSWSMDEEGEFWYEKALQAYKESLRRIKDFKKMSAKQMIEKYGAEYKRMIGIDISCFDFQNEKLQYPIKIAESETAIYENCGPSKSTSI